MRCPYPYVRLQAGAIGEVKVLSQEMPAPDS